MAVAVSVFPAQVKTTLANPGLQGGGCQPSPGHLSLVECRKGVKSRSASSSRTFSGEAIPMLRTESRKDPTIQATSSIVGKCLAIVTALRRRGSGRDWSWAMSIRKLPAQSKALVLSSGMVMADPISRSLGDSQLRRSRRLRLHRGVAATWPT